jgi:hypothetical protein
MKKVTFTTFAVGLCMTVNVWSQVPSYVPTNGLVGWWPFNGNANDESGNGNNGTVSGATLTTDRFGNADKAYGFDGLDDNIVVNNSNSLNPNQLSVSVWYLATGNNMCVISKNNPSNALNFSYQIKHQDQYQSITGLNTAWGNGNCNGYSANEFWGSDGQIPSLQWVNITFTIDDIGIGRVYFNGNLVSTYTGTTLFSCNDPSTILKFGGPNWNNDVEWFNGIIDDIGIWNRALSQQEITDLYASAVCSNDLSISPSANSLQTGNTANFTATTSDANASFIWQSDLGQGFQTLNDLGNYSGTTTNTLSISNVQLSEHNQQIRAISTSGNCIDTSDVAVLSISNTCTSNVTIYDTLTTNVYDTLTTNITIYDTLTTNIYDTLTTNITVYDTITTNITIYDTLTTNVYDTTYITVSDTLFTTVTDTLLINTTLSLPAPNNENTILIYPNPASDHITIDNGNFTAMAGYTIRIENNAGQQVFQSAIDQQQFYVDLSTWTGNGLYFVHLIEPQSNTITVRKIVLQ